MSTFRSACGLRLTFAAAMAAVCSSLASGAQDQPAEAGAAAHGATGGRELSSLKRVIRQFTFEEAETGPYVMPGGFYRVLTAKTGRPGFPDFGSMQLSADCPPHPASTGRWSMKFDLKGGSMATALSTDVINVLPLGDYVITGRLRTDGLNHARARLVAQFHDEHGQVIGQSIASSELLKTNGAWRDVAVEMFGNFENAADLVIELQLLQPRQFATEQNADRPLFEDVSGQVWFDDITVWQLPRIELTTDAPGNVLLGGGAPPRLNILIRDMTAEALTARLRVYDHRGALIQDESFDAPRGAQPQPVALAAKRFGWYHAELDVNNSTTRVGQSSLDFALLPEVPPAELELTNPFAVVIESAPTDDLPMLPEILQRCRVSSAVLPLWDRESTAPGGIARHAALRQAIDAMLSQRISLTLSIPRLPECGIL